MVTGDYKAWSLGTIRHGHWGTVESLRGAGVPRMRPCTLCQMSMNHEPP